MKEIRLLGGRELKAEQSAGSRGAAFYSMCARPDRDEACGA